ncbi:uncharacterized protein LOC141754120 isoform X2 [Sebastes fasciatus]|uniref:uncharacterized protein LOC141754120 isoform X2 n=1 Tax=Sebastes fasciatus TaxID=394691 RepID=UPI003D9E3108
MCKVQMLRALVKQRLTAAAEEICGLFERTIAEYEEELSRSKEENERQQKLLDAVFNPQLQLHRADIQQLLVVKEDVLPEQREWSFSLIQEDPESQHIKEEQEELWTSQEGEQLQGLEDADITYPVPVKSEDDKEEPQSSQFHQRQTEQMETETDGEDYGGPEPETDHSEVPVSDSRCSADVQQLLVLKEEVPPEQQEWSSSLDQEEPEPPHIKEEQEEQEELWTSQERDQLQGLEEAVITKFPFTPVPVKSEDDEEEPQSSQLHQRQTEQIETEADGEDCGGPEPAMNSDLDRHPEPDTVDKTGDCSEPETEVSDDDCQETREPQSGLNSLNNDEVPVNDVKCNAAEKSFICCECGRKFGRKDSLRRHMRFHTGEKPYSCSVCGKRFSQRPNLIRHMRCHSGEKPFSCSFCDTSFAVRSALVNHMRIHTGEKPFSCLYCDKSFTQKGGLKKHMTVHTGEKPYTCPVCDKSFSQKANLTYHFSVHTGQKQFSCSVCDKRFTWQSQVKSHKCVGESSSNN